MHHADQHRGVIEQQGQRLIAESARDDEAVDRAVALEQQHPGEGPHEHADPQRQEDAGEDDAAPRARKPRQREGDRERR